MAVIISNNDPIPTNPTPPANNDTSWMQDLIVEQKPKIIEQPTEKIVEIIENKIVEPVIQETKPIIEQNTSTTVPEIKTESTITNMYIAADQINNSAKWNDTNSVQPVATSTIEAKVNNPKAINLDDLFGNTNPKEETQVQTPKEENNKNYQAKQKEEVDHHTLQKFMFGLAWGLAIIAWGFFIIKTVFPLTFQNNTNTDKAIIETNTWNTVPVEQIHAAAPVVKTLAEVYTDKLTAYASSGQFYHEFGRETKNRNLIRYGLFIHKKSLDLQDDIQKAIVLSGQIDTVSIEAYLAQFDEYVGILQETVANDPELQTALATFTRPPSQTENNGDTPTQTPETGQNTGEQVTTQPTLDQFLNQVTQPQ